MEKYNIRCYPNLFSDFITITIPQKYTAKSYCLEIYNISGKRVRIIKTAENEIIWDGNNETGRNCSPGIYFVKPSNINSLIKILLTR